jgi:hypothetical protein
MLVREGGMKCKGREIEDYVWGGMKNTRLHKLG